MQDVGIGLEGKEGRQASLAADFSLSQFSHLRRLLLWHGRNSYQRSAKLSQFVVHRGLIIAVIQVIFSAVFYFIPLAIFQVRRSCKQPRTDFFCYLGSAVKCPVSHYIF